MSFLGPEIIGGVVRRFPFWWLIISLVRGVCTPWILKEESTKKLGRPHPPFGNARIFMRTNFYLGFFLSGSAFRWSVNVAVSHDQLIAQIWQFLVINNHQWLQAAKESLQRAENKKTSDTRRAPFTEGPRYNLTFAFLENNMDNIYCPALNSNTQYERI